MGLLDGIKKLWGAYAKQFGGSMDTILGVRDGEQVTEYIGCKIFVDATAGDHAQALVLTVVSAMSGGGGVVIDGLQAMAGITNGGDLLVGFMDGSPAWRFSHGQGFQTSDGGADNQKMTSPKGVYETARIVRLDGPDGHVCRIVAAGSIAATLIAWPG